MSRRRGLQPLFRRPTLTVECNAVLARVPERRHERIVVRRFMWRGRTASFPRSDGSRVDVRAGLEMVDVAPVIGEQGYSALVLDCSLCNIHLPMRWETAEQVLRDFFLRRVGTVELAELHAIVTKQ